jgi:hypothetical protein
MPASVACHATKRQHKTTPKRPNRLHLNTAWWCTLALHWLLVRVGRVCLGGENLVLCSARSRSAHSALYQKCALLIRCTGHTHPCFARFASLHAACSCCAHAAIRICRFAASAVGGASPASPLSCSAAHGPVKRYPCPHDTETKFRHLPCPRRARAEQAFPLRTHSFRRSASMHWKVAAENAQKTVA